MFRARRLLYPAIFTHEADGQFSIEFPDLQCATCAETAAKARVSAKELLTIHINGLIEDGESVPLPSPLSSIRRLGVNQTAVLVSAGKRFNHRFKLSQSIKPIANKL